MGGNELVQPRSQGGEIIENLFRERGNALYAYCLTLLRNPAEAEEAAQEAFLRLLNMREEIDPERDPAALLFTIARNLCLNRRKKRARETAGDVALLEAKRADPQEEAVRIEVSRRVRAEIGRLPVRQSEIVLLTGEGGLTLRESAEVMGISPGAAASHKARAFKQLRGRLEKDYREWMRDV
jgi:RNA polymerase sigma-70 factor (ECF subfamily)